MQETTCLSLRHLPYYLATLTPGQIKDPHIRHQVELYQEYAVDVIYEATFGPMRREVQRLKEENGQQSLELVSLRRDSRSLQVQGELFANADKLSAEAKVRGLLAAFSRPRVSMAHVCRHLKDETGFDPYPIRDEIKKLGGRATLLKIITAHGHAAHALDIVCRILR